MLSPRCPLHEPGSILCALDTAAAPAPGSPFLACYGSFFAPSRGRCEVLSRQKVERGKSLGSPRLFSLPWTGAGAAGVPSPGPDVTGCWLELEARVEALVQSPGQRQARPLRGGSQQASPRVCVGTEGRRTGCRPGASGLEAASTEDSGGRLGAEASVPGRGPVGVTGVGGPSPAATILGLRPRGPESRHSGDKSTSWRGHPPTGELVSEQGALPLGLHVRKA